MDVVVVSWHHDAWVSSCVASLAASAAAGVTIDSVGVVDNAGTMRALETPPGIGAVTVLGNPDNEGFARACNQGARCGAAEFVLFLNPDTRILPGALARAVSEMRTPEAGDVGVLGLQLVDSDGQIQRTCGRFPRPRTLMAQLLGLSRLAPRRCPGFRMVDWDHTTSRDVDFACGAALLVRRALFEQLAGFDERLFLYLEDADLSLRASARGWRTRFCAEARVQHACGWSAGSDRAWRLAQSWRSRLVYASTHFNRPSAWLLMVLLLVAGPLARTGEAVAQRTPRPALDAVRAWGLLLRLLADDRQRARLAPPAGFVTPLTPDGPAPRQA